MKNADKYNKDLAYIMNYCKESLQQERLFNELQNYIRETTGTKVYTFEDIIDWLYADMPTLSNEEFNYLSILVYPFYEKVDGIGVLEQPDGKYLTIRFKESVHKADIEIPVFKDEFSSFTVGTMYGLNDIGAFKNVDDLKKGLIY